MWGWHLLICWKHLHDHIISVRGEAWAYTTSSTPPPFTEVPVPRQDSERSCTCCVGDIDHLFFILFSKYSSLKIKILESTPKRKPRAYYTCTRKKPFRWVGFTDMTYIKQQLSRKLYGITYVRLQMVWVQLTMMLTVSNSLILSVICFITY